MQQIRIIRQSVLMAIGLLCFQGLVHAADETPALPADTAVQAKVAVLPDFDGALKKGDVKTVAKSFHATVELDLPDKKQTNYAKAQAEQIVRKFFEENKPLDCVRTQQFRHEEDECTVSALSTSNGNYRLSIRVRPVQNAPRIFSIRIEKQND